MSDKFNMKNKSLKALIKEFNNENTILVVSDYPKVLKNSERNHGMAWYTKSIIEPMARKYKSKFIVLGEKTPDSRPEVYANGKILVLRVFDSAHPSLFPVILRWLLIFNKVKYIQVHSEFCTNGGIKNFMLLLPFMMLIKMTRRNITYFSHNVVTDLKFLAKHLGIKRNSLKLKLYTFGLKSLYRMLGLIVDKFVVMDSVILRRLSLFVNPSKIVLNPFWINEPEKQITRQKARAKLGIKNDEFTLLYFGFVSYYKGADWIIKTVKNLRKKREFKKLRLIVAGGEAFSLKDQSHYKKFYKGLLDGVSEEKNIEITGFVAEEDIATYFKACDLTVLPYRGLIGGSGCFSQAICYKSPFVVSDKMSQMLESEDIKDVLSKNNIDVADLTFSHNTQSFDKVIKKAQNKSFLNKLSKVSESIGRSRSINYLAPRVYESIFTLPKIPPNIGLIPSFILNRV